MKRAVVLSVLLASFFFSLSASEDLFSFSIGPQSGLVFYSDEDVKTVNSQINGPHFLAGAVTEVRVNPFEQASFFLSADLLCDFLKQEQNHAYYYHIDFPFGIKIYPGLGGLCTGVAYSFGIRFDNVKAPEAEPEKNTTPWGNGFKFMVEYNFAHSGKSKYYPTLGVSWKHIPRGNNTCDNIISAYITANL